MEVGDPYWTDDAVEARRQSVGAVFDPPPVPRNLRERISTRRRRDNAWHAYADPRKRLWGRNWQLMSKTRETFNQEWIAGRVDPDTGQATEGALAENMAALGGPFVIPEGVPSDALSVDRYISALATKSIADDERDPA